mmetsp:Transcript_15829/g.45141  ORF Transcript_15829/g.45141 Transcript_15829/m.45141 type:complete len:99 (-) Transcript_15829:185-481(-)
MSHGKMREFRRIQRTTRRSAARTLGRFAISHHRSARSQLRAPVRRHACDNHAVKPTRLSIKVLATPWCLVLHEPTCTAGMIRDYTRRLKVDSQQVEFL